MSLYGNQDLLLKLQGTLLQSRYERKNTCGHAFFRTSDDIQSSDHGDQARDRKQAREKTIGERTMKINRILWLILGLISLIGVGIGAVLPMIPYFPFLMLSTFCFAKSSERLHKWIINTKLYKKNLESFTKGKGMTVGAKIRIMTTVTIVMAIGFVIMFLKAIYIPCIILACVWVMHILIFIFGIKTYVPKNDRETATEPKE